MHNMSACAHAMGHARMRRNNKSDGGKRASKHGAEALEGIVKVTMDEITIKAAARCATVKDGVVYDSLAP